VAKLAIVIPALGGVDLWEEGLVSVLQHRPADSEVLVVLVEPYNDPYDLKDEVRFVHAPRDAGLVDCLQRGLDASHAPLVHFLASGRQVEEHWAERAVRHFDDPQVAAVVPATISERAVWAGIRYSSGGRRGLRAMSKTPGKTKILGPELRAAFYRRAALEAIGGLETAVGDELADVELALALRQAGLTVALEPESRVREGTDGAPRVGAFRRGLHAERLFWRNAPARGWTLSLLAHPGVLATALFTAGSPTSAASHLLGRLLGGCGLLTHRARRERLARLRQNPPRLMWTDDEPEHGPRIDRAHERSAAPHTLRIEQAPPHRRAA
jgi:hypothetical protein